MLIISVHRLTESCSCWLQRVTQLDFLMAKQVWGPSLRETQREREREEYQGWIVTSRRCCLKCKQCARVRAACRWLLGVAVQFTQNAHQSFNCARSGKQSIAIRSSGFRFGFGFRLQMKARMQPQMAASIPLPALPLQFNEMLFLYRDILSLAVVEAVVVVGFILIVTIIITISWGMKRLARS